MKKILIANRGEIAIRVIKTCKKMGIATVAIYSEADRNALHVRLADEAFCVGPAPSAQSYLLGDKIIEICKQNQVDAVHPGYGFLSENAGFARKLSQAGVILIGPTAESMEVMGSKLAAKKAVEAYGVPLVPGINEAVEDAQIAMETAIKIGFPVLIKASAGGGGKGMRIVHRQEDLEQEMKSAISEAISAFGDGAVFVEKYVAGPRHIEIQVLGDNFGNIVYLFERECSVQRRHQKLVEEAPSVIVSPEMRQAMGTAAVNVAKACNYSGAGTVEFLVDESRNFYFLEMNTRLQVEHPVTEMITGLDLVEQQIKVAMGQPLAFTQEDLKINGHAIELRLCAENPSDGFLPDIGKLTRYEIPQGEHVRVDDCVEEGYEIPIYYDNMFSKLIVWGENRNQAIDRMKQAIKDYKVEGIANTLLFGLFVMQHPAFISGDFDTHFIKDHFTNDSINQLFKDEEEVAAIFTAWLQENDHSIVMPQNAANSDWLKARK
jgi:acetyl-CoA carboxylase, biotin carboxylase subunit